jgi:hypothetical protein
MIFMLEGATVLILTAIAALHLYWVLGGRFGLESWPRCW